MVGNSYRNVTVSLSQKRRQSAWCGYIFVQYTISPSHFLSCHKISQFKKCKAITSNSNVFEVTGSWTHFHDLACRSVLVGTCKVSFAVGWASPRLSLSQVKPWQEGSLERHDRRDNVPLVPYMFDDLGPAMFTDTADNECVYSNVNQLNNSPTVLSDSETLPSSPKRS